MGARRRGTKSASMRFLRREARRPRPGGLRGRLHLPPQRLGVGAGATRAEETENAASTGDTNQRNLVKQTARAVVPGDLAVNRIATRTPAWRYCRPSPRGRHRRWQWSGPKDGKTDPSIGPTAAPRQSSSRRSGSAESPGGSRIRASCPTRQSCVGPKTTLVQAAGTGYSTSAGRGEAAAEAYSTADRSEPCAIDRGAPSPLISTALTGARRAAARPDETRLLLERRIGTRADFQELHAIELRTGAVLALRQVVDQDAADRSALLVGQQE